MRRHARTGGEAVKVRRKRVTPKRRNGQKAARNPFTSPQKTRITLARQLREALEQQGATSKVLQVISGSPGDLQPVFATMLAEAVRICDANSEISIAGMATPYTLQLPITLRVPSPNFAGIRRFVAL